MPQRADHVADANGEELVRLAKLYDFPEYVKKADMAGTFRPQGLAVTVYADPVRRQYPCHTAASTWLSALYFTEKRGEFHPKDQARIGERLNHYVRFWRIGADVDRLRTKSAAYQQEAGAALPDSAYAYVWVDEATGRKERHLPLRNPGEVKRAAEYLAQYRDRFTFGDRHVMARRVLEKAARLGASVGEHREFLERQAGRGVCRPDRVVGMLEGRAKLASQPALKDHLVKLASVVKTDPRRALHPDNLVALAATVDGVDRGLGLFGKYSAAVPAPEDVIFEVTFTKAAAEQAELVALTSGNCYKRADLGRVRLDDLRGLFGNDFAEEVREGLDVSAEKLAELAQTLPRPDAELFEKLLADCRLRPVLQKAASVKQGFTDQDWLKLAEQYLATA